MAIVTPLDFIFEIFVNGTWVDVTTDIHEPSGVSIVRGAANESVRPGPSSCQFVLDNPSGNYSPRNANGPYYGSFGQNTPFRLTYRRGRDTANRTVSNGWGTSDSGHVWTSDTTVGGAVIGDFSVVPGALKHSIGAANNWRHSYLAALTLRNLDVQVDFSLTLASITGAQVEPANIMFRGLSGTSFYLARIQITTGGAIQIVFFDSAGGSLGPADTGLTYAASTVYRVRAQVEGQTIRAKVWLASGNEPYSWQYYAHTSITPVVAGWMGVRSGVATGNTNAKPIVFSYSNLTFRQPRYSGELADIDVDWKESENTIRAIIKAAGIRRRLGQGQSPLDSTLRRGNTTAIPTPVAYWPAEDDKNATSLASAIPNGQAMTVSGSADLASYTGFDASRAIPVLKGAYFDGLINAYTPPSPNKIQLRFIMVAPTSAEIPDGSYLVDLHNSGTSGLWRIKYRTTGDFQIEVWSNAFTGGPDLLTTSIYDFNIIGDRIHVTLELTQNGANVDWALYSLEVGAVFNQNVSGTLAGKTIGAATRVFVDPLKVCTGLAIGHIAVHPALTASVANELKAYVGETAGARLQRLCTQRGIPFSYVGTLTDTPPMGAQLPNDLLTLLDECADVDMGVLYESMGDVGFEYRTRSSMLNQSANLDLDYVQGHVQPGFKPVDNDERTRNDIKVSRQGGSSVRATLDVGPKSTLDPSAGGVGRYDTQLTTNPQEDAQLIDIAYWLLWLYTVNEARYPQIEASIGNDQMLNAGKLDAALDTNIADRMTVSNPPAKHISNQVTQLVRGYTEKIGIAYYSLTFNGVPEGPYEVMQVDTTGQSEISNDTTTITGGPGGVYSTSATSVQFTSTGDLWSTSAGDYPVDLNLNGETVRLTAISGAASPQTATITRSINSVVKTLPNGTAVKLLRPSIPG